MKTRIKCLALALLTGCASRSPQPTVLATHPKPPAPPLLSHVITIVVTNRVIFVDGEVMRPGRFLWTNGLTLTDAIEQGGGFTDFADNFRLELRRCCGGPVERFGFQRIVRGLTNNPVLNPGDHLLVRHVFMW